MRALVVDELSRADVDRLRECLARETRPSGVADLFWLELAADRLSPLQASHDGCGPHRLAVELGDDFARFELLVRPASGLACPCCHYLDPAGQAWLMGWVDELIRRLGVRT